MERRSAAASAALIIRFSASTFFDRVSQYWMYVFKSRGQDLWRNRCVCAAGLKRYHPRASKTVS